MRYWLISFLFSLACLSAFAQNPIHRTSAQGKRILIEQITGTNAPFSPDGQWILDSVVAHWPQVIPVSIHALDPMQIPDGQTAILGLGTFFAPGFWVDRVEYPAAGIEIVRGDLPAFTAIRSTDTVPGHIHLSHYRYNAPTRALEADVKVSFTDTATHDFRLNLYLVEDSVTSPSPGYGQMNYYDTVPGHPYAGTGNPIFNYPHRYVLREMLGGAWGLDSIIPHSVQAGDTFSHHFQFTLPATWQANRIQVVPVLQLFSPDSSHRPIWDSHCAGLRCTTPPDADFGWQAFGVGVEFSDSSLHNPQLWEWNFGDGTSSLLPHPFHLFPAPGAYQVTLIVQNACGADTLSRWIQVNCQSPDASFGFTLNNGQATFSDSSQHFPSQWHWDFGDGATSTQANPIHIYTAPGTYTICLITQNACGTDTTCQVLNLGCILPTGTFSWAPGAGLTMAFNSTVSPAVTAWSWYFGDGGISNSPNPTYVYSSPGTYQVCLTLTDSCGTSVHCQQVVVGCPVPDAQFSYISAGLVFEFSDQTTQNPTTWVWKFGDGSSSPLRNPVHTYLSPGSYTCCLIASNSCGMDTLCHNIEIPFETSLPASHTAGFSLFPVPAREYLRIQFDEPLEQSCVLSLFNAHGQVCMQQEWVAGQTGGQLSISHLPSGIYWAEVRNGQRIYRKPIPIGR